MAKRGVIGFIWSVTTSAEEIPYYTGRKYSITRKNHAPAQADAIRAYAKLHGLDPVKLMGNKITRSLGDVEMIQAVISACRNENRILVYCDVANWRANEAIQYHIWRYKLERGSDVRCINSANLDVHLDKESEGSYAAVRNALLKNPKRGKRKTTEPDRRQKIKTALAAKAKDGRKVYTSRLAELDRSDKTNAEIAAILNREKLRPIKAEKWTAENVRLERKRVVALRSKK